MLEAFVYRLYQKRIVNWAVVVLFFVFVLFLHDPMVRLSVTVMDALTRHTYNDVVAGTLMVILAGILFFFFKKLREHPDHVRTKIVFMLITVLFIWLHMQMLFVMNIEIIHSFQYGILAILIFPLFGRFGDAVFWASLLGAVDEWFQYQILYPDKNDYYDFNDVVLNMLGTGFAVVLLYTANVKRKVPSRKVKWYKSPVLIAIALIAIISFILFQTGLWQLYGSENASNAFLLFNKAPGPDVDFWRTLPKSDIVYHVLTPQEGLTILCGLVGFYYLLDRMK